MAARRVSARLARHRRLDISDVALIEVAFVPERVMKVSRPSVVVVLDALAAESPPRP